MHQQSHFGADHMRGGAINALAAAVAVASVAVAAAVTVQQPGRPDQLSAPQEPESVAVVSSSFDDARQVSLSATREAGTDLVVSRGGRITQMSCVAGQPLASGESALAVDGVPLLSLAMDVAPWRNVDQGATGADVQALQAALTSMGYDVSADGQKAGKATFAAFQQALAGIGAPTSSQWPIDMSQVLWLPRDGVDVSECTKGVGSYVAPGETVVVTSGRLTSVSVYPTPQSLVAGERVIVLAGVEIPLNQNLEVDDLALVPAGGLEGGDGVVTATLKLAEPIAVSAVPPAAVISDDGVEGCVVADGQPLPVTIVGSQLGSTFVRFGGQLPQAVQLNPEVSGCE